MKISPHQIQLAFIVSNDVYNSRLSRIEGIRKLRESGMNKSSANIYIQVFKHLMNGTKFTRTLNASSFDYFLENIKSKKGKKFLSNSLLALNKHILYFESTRKVKLLAVRKVYKKFKDYSNETILSQNKNNNLTGYWTFMCNPAKWEIDKFLETNTEYDTYQVNEWHKDHLKIGQLGIIRVGIDSRTKKQLNGRSKLSPGIYAIVEVIGIPKFSNQVSKYYLNDEDQDKSKLRVKIRYLKNLLNSPLLLKNIRTNYFISIDQYLIAGFQRSTMPLREDTFEEVIKLIGSEDQIYSNIENEPVNTLDDLTKLEKKYVNASPKVKEVISKRIERGNISNDIKKLYEYKCKVCEALGENPHTFKKKNGKYYIEAHHIVYVSTLAVGALGASNLITVCANHHRHFHYGDIKVIENTTTFLKILINKKSITITKKNI